jgi:protein-S-isoprenylcysteine O-methyltransferase Ste14
MRPGFVIIFLWGAWALSWVLASGWSNRTKKRLGLRGEVLHRLPLIAGVVLFAVPAHGYEGRLRLWHVGWAEAWGCVGLVAAGLAFTWWARIHLGRLWSGSITRKEEHRVVDTGPYAIVRHPIYSGILLAFLGTLLAKGTVLGLVGAGLAALGLFIKARLEERWLASELGVAYEEYRKRVPMLFPFGPRG